MLAERRFLRVQGDDLDDDVRRSVSCSPPITQQQPVSVHESCSVVTGVSILDYHAVAVPFAWLEECIQ